MISHEIDTGVVLTGEFNGSIDSVLLLPIVTNTWTAKRLRDSRNESLLRRTSYVPSDYFGN